MLAHELSGTLPVSSGRARGCPRRSGDVRVRVINSSSNSHSSNNMYDNSNHNSNNNNNSSSNNNTTNNNTNSVFGTKQWPTKRLFWVALLV